MEPLRASDLDLRELLQFESEPFRDELSRAGAGERGALDAAEQARSDVFARVEPAAEAALFGQSSAH
jgi:hypothetical protein